MVSNFEFCDFYVIYSVIFVFFCFIDKSIFFMDEIWVSLKKNLKKEWWVKNATIFWYYRLV